MDNCVGFNELMKLACEKSMKREIAKFDALDVSDVTVSPRAERRFKRSLKRALSKNNAPYFMLKRVAVACILIFALLVGITVTVEPVRAFFQELIMGWFDDHIDVSIEKENTRQYPKYVKDVAVPDLPEGWRIEPANPEAKSAFFIYTPDNEWIIYSQTTVTVDYAITREDYVIEEIELPGDQKGYLLDNQAERFMVLIWQEEYFFNVESFEADKEDIILAAKLIAEKRSEQINNNK